VFRLSVRSAAGWRDSVHGSGWRGCREPRLSCCSFIRPGDRQTDSAGKASG
jgi:hypothetical protein